MYNHLREVTFTYKITFLLIYIKITILNNPSVKKKNIIYILYFSGLLSPIKSLIIITLV